MLIHSSKLLGRTDYLSSPSEAPDFDKRPLNVGGHRPSPPGCVPQIDGLPEELFAFAAGLSAAVYRSFNERGLLAWPGVEASLKEDGATRLEVFDKNGLQAAAFVLDERAWIAFRGTDPMEVSDWGFDFGVLPFYHFGFRRAWSALRPDVMRWVASVAPEVQSYVFTGHSLGGALATLAADAFVGRDTGWLEAVITFGAPRVGSPWFARRYNQQPTQHATDPDSEDLATLGAVTWRIHNRSDVVPHVPPSLLGFRHIGQSLPIIRPTEEAPPGSWLQVGNARADGPLQRLADHYKSVRDLRPSLGYNPLELYLDALFWIGERPGEHMMRLYGQAFGDTLSFRDLPPEPAWMKRSPAWWERAIVWTAAALITALLLYIPYLLFQWSSPTGRAFMIMGLTLTVLYTLIDYLYRPAPDYSRRETLFGQ